MSVNNLLMNENQKINNQVSHNQMKNGQQLFSKPKQNIIMINDAQIVPQIKQQYIDQNKMISISTTNTIRQQQTYHINLCKSFQENNINDIKIKKQTEQLQIYEENIDKNTISKEMDNIEHADSNTSQQDITLVLQYKLIQQQHEKIYKNQQMTDKRKDQQQLQFMRKQTINKAQEEQEQNQQNFLLIKKQTSTFLMQQQVDQIMNQDSFYQQIVQDKLYQTCSPPSSPYKKKKISQQNTLNKTQNNNQIFISRNFQKTIKSTNIELKKTIRQPKRQQNQQKNKTTLSNTDKFQSQIYYFKLFQWKKGSASIQNNQLIFNFNKIPFNLLIKLKILLPVFKNTKRIRLSTFSQSNQLYIQPSIKVNDLQLHYCWFAKIINFKLKQKGFDIQNAYFPEIIFTNKNVKNGLIDGIIYKKSKYLKKWCLRYVAITEQGLFSFKDQKGNATFFIKNKMIEQIWTRFDIYEQMLVIKLHHNQIKTQFAIPIADYCIKSHKNWLYYFYQIMYS